MGLMETDAWRVWQRLERICRVERIRWYCKQSGEVKEWFWRICCRKSRRVDLKSLQLITDLLSIRSESAAEWKGWRMERIMKVQTVKFAGPEFNSVPPERRKKARWSVLRITEAECALVSEQEKNSRLGTGAAGVLLTSREVQGKMIWLDLARTWRKAV